MATYLDEAAISGGAPAAPSKRAPAVGGFLNEDQITGRAAEQPFEAEARAMQTSGGALKDIASGIGGRLAGAAAQVSDMGTGILGSLAGIPAFWGANTAALAAGASRKEAAGIAAEARETFLPKEVTAPWSVVAKALGPEAEHHYQDNPVAWVMGKVNDVIQGGGDKLQENTGIPSEYVGALADQVMGSLGFKAAKVSVAKSMAARAAKPGAEVPKAVDLTEPPPVDPGDLTGREPTKAEIKDHKTAVKEREAAIDSLVVDKTKLAEIFPVAKAKGPAAEAALVQSIFDRVLKPVKRQRIEGEPDTFPVEDYVGPALEKLRVGTLLSKEETAAVQSLKVDAAAGELKTPDGTTVLRKGESGKADPAFLGVLAAMGISALAVPHLVDWWNSSDVSGDTARDVGTLGAVLTFAGVPKAKGGFWRPDTVKTLAEPLRQGLLPSSILGAVPIFEARIREGIRVEESKAVLAQLQAPERMIVNYLNKHAGMSTDPIKDLHLPSGERWEDLIDKALTGAQAEGPKGPEVQWGLNKTIIPGQERPGVAAGKITSYLSHVGDYIKSRNFTPEQLQQLDLPRAIRETVANDQRIAEQALKDATRPNPQAVHDTAQLPTYKAYDPVQAPARKFSFNKDGSIQKTQSVDLPAGEVTYAWKELRVPETLTPAQAGRITKSSLFGKRTPDGEPYQFQYVALDAKGKPIKDNFSEQEAMGSTPQEAHLAGQLAQEGNALGHCVGDYVDFVIDGSSRILSLRDQHGRSYATVELSKDRQAGWPMPDRELSPHESIVQIKGPGNGPPADYVKPYLQDLVKSGKWGEVADLEHAGLAKLDPGASDVLRQHLGGGDYVDPVQLRAAMDALNEGKPLPRQAGAADPKLLLKIAGGAAAAAYLINNHDPDTFTQLAAGVFGAAMLKGRVKFEGDPAVLKAFRDPATREAAAAQIWTDTHDQLERSIKQMSKDVDSQDISQRVYEKVFRFLAKPADSPEAFRGDAKISTLLHAMAQNEVKNQWRAEASRPRTSSLEVDPETGASAAPEGYLMEQSPELYRSTQDQVAQRQMVDAMQGAIDKLSPERRAVFEASELEGLSDADIAAKFDLPVGTVKSRLSRAKEDLQHSLRAYRNSQSGQVDPKLLAAMGLTAGGAALGVAASDNPLLGGLAGAAGGLGLAALFHVKPTEVGAAIKRAIAPDTRIRINQFADVHDADLVTAERFIAQQVRAVIREAPSIKRLNQITNAIQQGTVAALPSALQAGARVAKNFFDSIATEAQKAGILTSVIEDYVTNLWDLTGRNKDVWERILNNAGGPSMSPTTRFNLKRSIANLEVGKQLGLTPVTENVAAIMHTYGMSMARTMANAKMLESLRAELDPLTGNKLVMKGTKAPHAYVSIDHPQFSGMRVHPDIAPSLRFIFDVNTSGGVSRGIQALNTAVKRSAVMASLFHAKALMDGFVGAAEINKKLLAGGAAAGAAYGVATDKDLMGTLATGLIGAGAAMMLPAGKHIAQAAAPGIFGENPYIKQLRTGVAGDQVGELLNAGLKISMEKGHLVDEDVGGSFYAGMKSLQMGLDKVLPGSGLPIKGLIALNHGVDGFMWERLHAGMKLTIAAQKLEQLIINDAKAGKNTPRAELAVHAASFTNDIFGGLNWRRIAEATQSQWGRDLALQAYSPTGRRWAQLAFFAPDWTVSTARAATQAFSPSMSDLHPTQLAKSFLAPENAVGLHRQYMLRSALYYATIANGLNYAMSGHFVWDNKDPTSIDLGNGQTMQWSKHMMEPVHWGQKPIQQAANKLGFFPKEIVNQITGKEYISAAGKSPPMDTSSLGRMEHLAKSMMPIGAQQAFGGRGSVGGAVSSTLGVPIYGQTYEDRAAAKQALKDLHKTPEWKAAAAQRRADKKAKEARP